MDISRPQWKGKGGRALVGADGAVIGAVFSFESVVIPRGVTLKFKGEGLAVLQSKGPLLVEGDIVATGSAGLNGSSGLTSTGALQVGAGGGGGAGGTGNAQPNGNGGEGAYGSPVGADGAGPASVNRPALSYCGYQTYGGGSGGFGGTNGTIGALAETTIDPTCILPAPLGSAYFGTAPVPAGGGSAGYLGEMAWSCSPDFGVTQYYGSSGTAGGGGGGGGSVFLQSDQDIVIDGVIDVTGGLGGTGGNGITFQVNGCSPSAGIGTAGGGGGGGGAGGFIRLVSATKVEVTGQLMAAGGVGGFGGNGALPLFNENEPTNGCRGGAGGGGRISAEAPVVVGVHASDGAPAEGPSTPGLPSVSLGLYVYSMTFDHTTSADNSDGFPLRVDLSNTVAKPEWIFGVRDQAPTAGPMDATTSYPGAYLSTKPISVRVVFRAAPPGMSSATISASIVLPDGTASPYGSLSAKTVTFTNGESEPIVFTSSSSASGRLGAFNLAIRWHLDSGTDLHGNTVPPHEFARTDHRVYAIQHPPVAPMAEPWIRVLELSSSIISGLDANPPDQQVFTALAGGIFNSEWTYWPDQHRYFTPVAAYVYDPGSTCTIVPRSGLTPQTFDLEEVLERLTFPSALNLMCSDNANLLVTLAAGQGINSHPTLMMPATDDDTLITQYYIKAGEPYGSPTPCGYSCFAFHQVGELNGAGLYDDSAQGTSTPLSLPSSSELCTPLSTDTKMACEYGSNFFGVNAESYLPQVFYARSTSNTIIKPATFTIAPTGCAIQ